MELVPSRGVGEGVSRRLRPSLALDQESIDSNRNNPWAFFHLAGCLAHLGFLDEARQEVKAGLAVNPMFTIARFRVGMESDNPVFLAQREPIVEGLRMAGVPE